MSASLPTQMLEPLAERFRILGDATRLTILQLLLEHGELNVGDLSRLLCSSQANVSKHLRTLHGAGNVERRAEGTAAYYRMADSSVSQLCDIVCARLRVQAAETARAFARV